MKTTAPFRPSWIQKLGARISPGWGLRRLVEERQYHEFAYDAARPSVERKYAPQNINPNSFDVQRDRLQLMREGFDLEKNFAPAKALNQKVAMYSSPESYHPATGDAGLNRDVDEYLAEWFETCDLVGEHTFFEMLQYGWRGVCCAGDYGWAYMRPGLPAGIMTEAMDEDMMLEIALQYPLCIQAVEPDRIGGVYQNVVSNDYIAGVVLGDYGQPVAFRIFKRSPIVSQYTDPVDVPLDQFVHVKDGTRKDAMRPPGKLDTCAALLRDMYETLGFMRGKQKLASALTVFTNSIGVIPGNGAMDPYATTLFSNSEQALQQDIKYGQMNHLLQGMDVKFPDTATPGGESQFLLTFTMKLIAMSYNLPYSFALDAAELGGVSTRLESEMAKDEFRRVQRLLGRKATCIKNAAILDACAKGFLPSRRYQEMIRGTWGFMPHPQPDLGKEASAAVSLYNCGLLDPIGYWTEQQRDPEEVADNFVRWEIIKENAVKKGQLEKPDLVADGIFKPQQGASQPGQPSPSSPQPQQKQFDREVSAEHPRKIALNQEQSWDESKHTRKNNGEFVSGGGEGVEGKDSEDHNDKPDIDLDDPSTWNLSSEELDQHYKDLQTIDDHENKGIDELAAQLAPRTDGLTHEEADLKLDAVLAAFQKEGYGGYTNDILNHASSHLAPEHQVPLTPEGARHRELNQQKEDLENGNEYVKASKLASDENSIDKSDPDTWHELPKEDRELASKLKNFDKNDPDSWGLTPEDEKRVYGDAWKNDKLAEGEAYGEENGLAHAEENLRNLSKYSVKDSESLDEGYESLTEEEQEKYPHPDDVDESAKTQAKKNLQSLFDKKYTDEKDKLKSQVKEYDALAKKYQANNKAKFKEMQSRAIAANIAARKEAQKIVDKYEGMVERGAKEARVRVRQNEVQAARDQNGGKLDFDEDDPYSWNDKEAEHAHETLEQYSAEDPSTWGFESKDEQREWSGKKEDSDQLEYGSPEDASTWSYYNDPKIKELGDEHDDLDEDEQESFQKDHAHIVKARLKEIKKEFTKASKAPKEFFEGILNQKRKEANLTAKGF